MTRVIMPRYWWGELGRIDAVLVEIYALEYARSRAHGKTDIEGSKNNNPDAMPRRGSGVCTYFLPVPACGSARDRVSDAVIARNRIKETIGQNFIERKTEVQDTVSRFLQRSLASCVQQTQNSSQVENDGLRGSVWTSTQVQAVEGRRS